MLERESVWLHMLYKFYLELIRGGLYDEFWNEAQYGFVPFMPLEQYGRSLLECSSWLHSSANGEEELWGFGESARLSGATAEFLSMWSLIVIGPTPFLFKDHQLYFNFNPVVPSWLFTENKTFTFQFLSEITFTYRYISDVCDTWKSNVKIDEVKLLFPNETIIPVEKNNLIGSPYAELIRAREVSNIDVAFTC